MLSRYQQCSNKWLSGTVLVLDRHANNLNIHHPHMHYSDSQSVAKFVGLKAKDGYHAICQKEL